MQKPARVLIGGLAAVALALAAVVATPAIANAASISISYADQVGQTVKVTDATTGISVGGVPATYTIAWLDSTNDDAVLSSTASYLIQASVLGHQIYPRITLTSGALGATFEGFLITVQRGDIVATSAKITGSPVRGAKLTASVSGLTTAAVSKKYAWYRGGTTPIPGATASTYTPTTSDVGKTLTAAAAFSPVPGYSYQWYANGKAISKATSKTFTITSAQVGTTITVKVTGTRTNYVTVSKISRATAKVVR